MNQSGALWFSRAYGTSAPRRFRNPAMELLGYFQSPRWGSSPVAR